MLEYLVYTAASPYEDVVSALSALCTVGIIFAFTGKGSSV